MMMAHTPRVQLGGLMRPARGIALGKILKQGDAEYTVRPLTRADTAIFGGKR